MAMEIATFFVAKSVKIWAFSGTRIQQISVVGVVHLIAKAVLPLSTDFIRLIQVFHCCGKQYVREACIATSIPRSAVLGTKSKKQTRSDYLCRAVAG